MCCSSHVLCYGCVRLCVINNYFALHDGKVIHTLGANKAECQWTQIWSHRTGLNFPFLRGEESNTYVVQLNHIIFNSLWCRLHLKNQKFLFAFKTFYEETKRFLSYKICYLKRNLELIVVWWIIKETLLF